MPSRRAAPDRRSCNASTCARRRYPAARRGVSARLARASWSRRRSSPRLCGSPSRRSPRQAGQGIDLDEAEAADLTRNIRAPCSQITGVPATRRSMRRSPGSRAAGHARSAVGCPMSAISPQGSRRAPMFYELMLYLEDSPAIGEAIVAWLTSDAKIIKQPDRADERRQLVRLLIVSAHPPDVVRDALLARDPERQCVKSLRQVGGDTLLSDVSEAGGPWRHRLRARHSRPARRMRRERRDRAARA